MRLSYHGGSENTEGPSISSHADRENLGLDNQGAPVPFGVTRGVRHVRHSYNPRKYTFRYNYRRPWWIGPRR